MTCFVLALIGAILDRPAGSFWIWIAAAIVYGVLLAFVYGPQAPIDANELATPIEMVENSRRHFRYYTAAIFATYAASTTFVTGLTIIGVLGAFTYGAVAGIGSGVANNAYGRWALLTRGWLRLTGDLPGDLLPFLEEAHRRRYVPPVRCGLPLLARGTRTLPARTTAGRVGRRRALTRIIPACNPTGTDNRASPA